MIQRECKCLAVVDFVAVSKHIACMKSIRHGHPRRYACGGRTGR